METTSDFVFKLREKIAREQGKTVEKISNYAIAKYVGQTETAVAKWTKGAGSFSDETAIQFATILNLDSAYVVACIHAERTKSEPERALWTRIANLSIGLAAVLVLTVSLSASLGTLDLNNGAAFMGSIGLSHGIHYAK